jgi:hypothetical protein
MKMKQICFFGFLFLILLSSCMNKNKNAIDSQSTLSEIDNTLTIQTIHESGVTVNYSSMINDYSVNDSDEIDFSEKIIRADVYIDETEYNFRITIYIATIATDNKLKENISVIELISASGNTVEDTFDSIDSDLELKIVSYLTNEEIERENINSILRILMRIVKDVLN